MFNTLLIQPLTNGLVLFYKVLGNNMGLAIIGFSVFLRYVLNPLTKPYLESMKKMKDVAPQLEKLKKRHKSDSVKLAQAQSELYRQKGVRPGAGCLPYLLQIVVLIAFFNVFTRTLTPNGDPTQRFNELLYPPLKFSETQKINTNFLYLDVTKPDVFEIEGIPFSFPGPIIILAALIQFISVKISAPYQKAQEQVAEKTKESMDDIQAAMQKSMVFTFPLITLIIGRNFPSGLAIYWFMFSFIQAFQQYKTYGWGGLSPFVAKLGLIKSEESKEKRKK